MVFTTIPGAVPVPTADLFHKFYRLGASEWGGIWRLGAFNINRGERSLLLTIVQCGGE
jgi:hypothetical protein